MNIIDRHVLREWLQILLLVLCAMLGLLLMQAMYDEFRDLLEYGAGFVDVVMFFLVLMPSYFTIVLPMSLLISLLYALGQLHRSNEFTAMRAAGLGIFRITRGIWVAGFVLCGVVWMLNSKVVPWSVEESRRIKESLEYQHQAKSAEVDKVGLVKSVAFDNRKDGRLWFINRYSRFAHRGYGVTISHLDAQRRETVRLMAREAWYDVSKHGWILKDGREQVFEVETGMVVTTRYFADRVLAGYSEDPDLMMLIDRSARSLSFYELRRLMDYFAIDNNPKGVPYAVQYHGILAETFGCLVVIALAIPFAVSGVRVSPVIGVSKSLGLFVVFLMLMRFSSAMGARQTFSPELAAWLPNIAMTCIAAYFFKRMR